MNSRKTQKSLFFVPIWNQEVMNPSGESLFLLGSKPSFQMKVPWRGGVKPCFVRQMFGLPPVLQLPSLFFLFCSEPVSRAKGCLLFQDWMLWRTFGNQIVSSTHSCIPMSPELLWPSQIIGSCTYPKIAEYVYLLL